MKTVEVIETYNSKGVMISKTFNGVEQEIPEYFKDNPSIFIWNKSDDLVNVKQVRQVPGIELNQ